jgi:putative cofactor-binding repeat protein
LIRHCFERDIPVAAICGAPEILAELDLLQDREVTCYPGLEAGLVNKGAKFLNYDVVIDGNLITSQAAGTSQHFAFVIAEALCGKEKADEVYNAMKCR